MAPSKSSFSFSVLDRNVHVRNFHFPLKNSIVKTNRASELITALLPVLT